MSKEPGFVKMVSQHDQEMECAVAWVKRQMNSQPEAKTSAERLAVLITTGSPNELRGLDDDVLRIVQRFAWIGLTKALEIYTSRREQEQWQ